MLPFIWDLEWLNGYKPRTGLLSSSHWFLTFQAITYEAHPVITDVSEPTVTILNGVLCLVLTTESRPPTSPTPSIMSESRSGTQSTKRPMSPTGESEFTRSHKRATHPSISESPTPTPAGSEAESSERVLADPSQRIQRSSGFDSKVATHSEEILPVGTGQASCEYNDGDYHTLLELAYETLKAPKAPKQSTGTISGFGALAEGTHDCVSSIQTSNGINLHRRPPHKEKVINKLPADHAWSNWKEFADANHCDLVFCRDRKCPSYRIPSLRYQQSYVDDTVQGVDENDPTDLEILKAEFGLTAISREVADNVLEGFQYGIPEGLSRTRSHFGYRDRTADVDRRLKGWLDYKTSRNIHIIQRAMEESRKSGNTVGGSEG